MRFYGVYGYARLSFDESIVIGGLCHMISADCMIKREIYFVYTGEFHIKFIKILTSFTLCIMSLKKPIWRNVSYVNKIVQYFVSGPSCILYVCKQHRLAPVTFA